MAEEGLKIKIGADVVEVVQSLNQLQTEFNDLNKQIKNAVPGSTQFNNLSAQLDVIKTKIKAVNDASAGAGSTGLKNLTNETGRANIALVNFGRVVQDAPFGIIGIANNIDPLLSSFQSLKKETGSSGAAFKALVASLTGPAGLAIAVSSVTSLLIVLGPKLGDFISGVSESEKALQDIAGSTAESFRKAQLEFEKLSNVITSGYSTYDQQKQALDDINQSLSSYGVQIKNVSDFQKNASQIGILYTQIKQEEARGLALAAKSAEEYAKQVVNQSVALQAAARLAAGKALGPLTGLWQTLTNSVKEYNANSKVSTAVQNQNIYNNALATSNANLQNLLNQLGKIDGVTSTNANKQSKANKKAKQDVFDLADVLKKYREELKGINWDEQNRGIDGSKKRLELAGETLRSLYLAGVKQTASAWKEVSNNFDKFGKDFDKYLAAQKLAELNKFIENYKLAFKELDIKQSITGQDQLNSRINLTIDALIELKKAGQENTAQYQDLQKTLNELKAEVGLREIRKRQLEIAQIWQKYTLSADKLDFNKTRGSLDLLKSKIDLIGNTIQDLKSKGLTDQDLGIQVLGAQLNGLLDQFNKLQQQKEVFDALRSTIEGGLTNAFSSVFDALLEGEDVFKALSDSIKRLVADLIKTVIQMIIVRKIASALVPGVGGKIGEEVFAVVRGDMLRNITFAR